MHVEHSAPVGYCKCGCGGRTNPSSKTDRKRGKVAGQPLDYICGHNRRGPDNYYVVEDRGYETPCWIWRGWKNPKGYASIRRNGRQVYTHRYMYELHVGPIPEGLHIDHLCRETSCCNPNHLEPVTPRENIRRAWLAQS